MRYAVVAVTAGSAEQYVYKLVLVDPVCIETGVVGCSGVVIEVAVDEPDSCTCEDGDSVRAEGELLYEYVDSINTVWIEGVGDDLGYLTPGGVGVRSEVGLVAHSARFTWAAARIAADDVRPVEEEAFHEHMESATFLDILEGLGSCLDLVIEACGIGDDLGNLPPSGIGCGTEVGQEAGQHTRLAYAAAWVAGHNLVEAQTL